MSDVEKKHCTEISLDEAVHVMQMGINQYKAFKKMHAVLQLVQVAEQRVKEADDRHEKLVMEIDAKRSIMEGLEREIIAATQGKDEASKYLAEHIKRIQGEHDIALEKAQDEFNDALESLVIKRKEAEEAHTLAMNDLKADKESAQAHVNRLRKILADLKKTASTIE